MVISSSVKHMIVRCTAVKYYKMHGQKQTRTRNLNHLDVLFRHLIWTPNWTLDFTGVNRLITKYLGFKG